MEKIWFGFYYLKLRLEVLTGKHKTEHPLDLKWRWKHWKRNREHHLMNLY